MATRGKPTPHDVIERFRKLIGEGRSYTEAARIVGVNRKTICRIMRKTTL